MDIFDLLDQNDDDYKIIKAPFAYTGSKSKCLLYILEHLPYDTSYIEPFGGSASVLLGRKLSTVEVYNDRYGGVVDFYRCLKNEETMNKLIDFLAKSIYSRELFNEYKDTWQDYKDIVERAARWYYITRASFNGLGRNFGIPKGSATRMPDKLFKSLDLFSDIFERFRNVIVENLDFTRCIEKYDSPNAVFYLDPPYLDVYANTYKHEMSVQDHNILLNLIFNGKGFFALSGYHNELYDRKEWDKCIEYSKFIAAQGVYADRRTDRGSVTEVLWIKDNR